MRKIMSIALCAVFILCLVGCSSGTSTASIRVLMDSKPINIDPQLAESTEELAITRNCFEGLFRYENGVAVMASAASYTVSDDGLEWRITLRDGLKWSDGAAVTASDFVFGIKRSISPETVAKNAKKLTCIKGASAVLEGTASADTAGIYSDGSTVVIELEQKCDSLPEILSRAICMPCRKDIFDKAKGRYGMSDKLVVCNGPYTLASIGDSTVKIKANEHYSGEFQSDFSQIVFSYGATESERIASLSDHLSDMAFISSGSADEAHSAGLSVNTFKNTAWIISINKKAETLGEDGVSAAIKASIDSSAYSDILPFSFSAFGGVIADELKVSGKSFLSQSGARAPLKASPDASNALITALEKNKGKLSTVSLIYPEEYELKQTAARIAQYIQQQLGIVVNITPSSSSKLESDIKSGNYQMAILPVSSDDGFAMTALENMVYIGLCDSPSTSNPIAAEKDILDDPHIIPLAQSGRCIAANESANDIKLDLFEGVAAFYSQR